MKKLNFWLVVCILSISVCHVQAGFKDPYGVNIFGPCSAGSIDRLKAAGIDRYRVFVKWNETEPTNLPQGSNQYNYFWMDSGISAAQRTGNAKICYTFTDIAPWAWVKD